MEHLLNLLLVATVSLVAAISPGPDFFIVVRNSLVYSRRAGYLTTLGIMTALLIHLTYTLIGIGVIIGDIPFLYHLVKYLGAAYLFYIGIKGILQSFKSQETFGKHYQKSTHLLSDRKAFIQGFITNLLNPKVALFFISLFSQFITQETPFFIRFQYALVNWSVGLGWFIFVTYLITGKQMTNKMDRFRKLIDRIMGSLLVAVSIKIIFI